MNQPFVKSIEINHISQRLRYVLDINTCTTFLSVKGILRVTFEREISSNLLNPEEDVTLPQKITHEYRVDSKEVSEFFEKHDFTKLHQKETDYRVLDGYIWKMKISTSEGTRKLEGNTQPPAPFGPELEEFILNLVQYEEEPWLF